MPKRHDDQTLFNALEHIVYEIRMFVDLTFAEMKYPPSVQFAILEAWGIHLRGIEGMLDEKSNSYDDDVLISHYGQIDIKELVEPSVRKRINGEITHLTTRRMNDSSEKGWSPVEIFRQAWPGIEKIIDVLITWVNEYQPDGPWRSILAELRAHGANHYTHTVLGHLPQDVQRESETHAPNVAATYSYGYLPRDRADSNSSNIPFL